MYPEHHNRVRSGTMEETSIHAQHQDRCGSNPINKNLQADANQKLLTLGCRDL